MAVEIHECIDTLAPEWEDLANQAGAMPWLRPGWIAAWWRAFGRGRLHIATLRRRGRLAGLAPLQSHAGRLSSLSNWHTPEFGLLADGEKASQELAWQLVRGMKRWFTFSSLDEEGRSLGELQTAANQAGARVLVRVLECSPFVQTTGTWKEYVAGLQGKQVREVARSRRRLGEKGDVVFGVEDGTQHLESLLEEGFELEAAGWKGTNGTAISSNSSTRRFYQEFARWAASRGSLRVAFLRLDGRAIAFDLCFEESGVHYALKSGYDPSLAKFGPGILLRNAMIERAFSSDVIRYEFLGRADEWKLRWASDCHRRLRLQVFAPSSTGFLAWTAYAYGRPLAKHFIERAGSWASPKSRGINSQGVTT